MDDRRRPLLASAAAVCVSVAVWCSLGTLTLSSSAPSAERIGVLPPLWVLGAIVLAALAAAWVVRPRRDVVLPWFLSVFLILPWTPLPWPPAVLAPAGPITLLAWAAIAAASLSVAHWRRETLRVTGGWLAGRRAPAAASLLALAVYLAASWHTAPVLPGGDEPHYLIITQSLLDDGDLRIENNHAQGDYRSYFRGVLRPDYLRRGLDREIYSIHLPGVSVLIAPAFALGGYPGVRVWLAMLAALAAGATWHMAWRMTGSAAAAWFATAGAGLSVPFLFLAFTVYPDGPGAVIVAAIFALLVAGHGRASRPPTWWAAAGTLAAALPWLHPRFAVLAASFGLVFVVRALETPQRWRALAAFAAVPVASAAGWFGYYLTIYGSPNPSVAYGHYTQMSLSNAIRGIPGLLFDQQFGLVATAPVFAVALVGLIPLVRRHRRLGIEWLAIVVPYATVTAMYHMWWGGQSSPARFLGPVMLVGAVPMAVAWRSTTSDVGRTLQAMALAASAALSLLFAGVEQGRLAFSFRDGYAQWAVWASSLSDVSLALPSWFRVGWQHGATSAMVWLAALAGGWAAARWISSRWTSSPGSAAVVTGSCMWAAIVAAMSGAWQVEGASGVAPTTGQLALIRTLASDGAPVTVSYSPLTVGQGRRLAHGVRLGGDRVAGAPADAWLWLPNLPAGRYELWADNRRAGASFDLDATIGRASRPLAAWHLRDAKPGPQSFNVTLPVDVHSLGVRGAGADRDALRGLWLQPVAITAPGERVTEARAIAAGRYGDGAIVWAVGEGVYLEAQGLWIAAESDARLVIEVPDDRAACVIGLRAGPVPVTASVRSGAFAVSVALAAGERRAVSLPRTGTHPVLVQIRTDTGFRPAQVDSASTDDRYLGVWIDFP